MKTESVSLLIGTVISGCLSLLAYFYLTYKETPSIQRAHSPALEAVEGMDLRLNDMKYKIRGTRIEQPPVALIAIDDASVMEVGRFPWSREVVADMTQKLLDLQVKSVAFDVIFAEPEKSNPLADKKLGSVVEKNPDRVILGTFSENKTNFLPYQDLCVAEAFLKTGGDQIVKLNPRFTIDEPANAIDELNWGPLFAFLFESIQGAEEKNVLKQLEKSSLNDLSPFQKNFLAIRKDKALFEYCQTWLTPSDLFLGNDLVDNLKPLYTQVIAESPELSKLSFDQLLEKIRNSFQTNPIPQYGAWTGNVPEIQNPAMQTASFIAELDSDGYVRRYPLFFRSGSKLGTSFIPSMALESYLLSGSYRAQLTLKAPRNGKKRIDEFTIFDMSKDPEQKIATFPVDKSGQMLINYYGRQMSLPYVSAKELFNEKTTIRVQRSSFNAGTNQIQIKDEIVDKAQFFKDRSVIVGATAVGLYDLRNTPIEANYPGPEIHLTMLANMLQGDFLSTWNFESRIMPWIILISGILLSFSWAYFGAITSMALFLGATILFFAVDSWFFFVEKILLHSTLIYFNILFSFIAIQIYKYFTEEQKKKALKATFAKYVSPAVVDELLKDSENLKLGGRRERMTAFFSDVRNFTTISEKLPPEELSRVLNLYLTPMTNIVFENKGTLDKYMGDAIMAFFGAPIKSSTHANEACRCALQSLVKLKEIQDSFKAQNLPLIDIGIGINTGEMSVGNMGSHIVQNYTIMGDAVNLASRLEGINKEYGTRIIISEFTNEEIKDEFTAREVDRVRVKGKLKPVKIYELICEGKPDEILQSRLNTYNQGLSLYQNKNFKEALQKFEESKVSYQNDPVVELYIKRCQEYLQVPPPEGWDGVYLMKTK